MILDKPIAVRDWEIMRKNVEILLVLNGVDIQQIAVLTLCFKKSKDLERDIHFKKVDFFKSYQFQKNIFKMFCRKLN